MYQIIKKNSQTNLKKIYLHSISRKHMILSFYKYFFVNDPKKLLNLIKIKLEKKNILGRIYISEEGINALISIPIIQYKYIKHFFKNINKNTKRMYMNYTIEDKKIAFWDLKIIFKKQIVSNKIKNFSFYGRNQGIYLNAWLVNKYFFDPNCIFLDMRNSYEYEIGHFSNAMTLPAQTFREQLEKLPKYLDLHKNKKIIMYCTGGIRCEKSTALLKYYGFPHVYHIYGGILSYIKQVKKYNLPNYFKGKIFVFDARLSEKITDDILSKCMNCQKYTDRVHINCFNDFCHRLFIQCRTCSIKLNSCCCLTCKNTLYK
ncbi:UPF0176 protein YceA [Buchnera aphidicola (Cinara kochiana kochiana)]|uniref:tRNA uridine(34) hydroxylase n=1 Tax=Buchnera aphidicola (Cinara kochiana kochiana) TaxID=2518976 RepID=A0A451D5M0_9GAMM|nr:rhodanese-related sulfurtransferase [Buchnera aphidicola]VFP81141.1 UPF0176 protein YceA [Buchnera aphidicola (Cinara kochiana kochiana)]